VQHDSFSKDTVEKEILYSHKANTFLYLQNSSKKSQ
jgi:hypothetical protein